jgi:hypothetical protein
MARKRVSAAKRKKNKRVSAKIEKLRLEGVPPERAMAASYSMERAGRLGPGGSYRRVHPKGSRKSPFARDKRRKRARGGYRR